MSVYSYSLSSDLWFLPRIIASSPSICSPPQSTTLPPELFLRHSLSCHCPAENLHWLSTICSGVSKDLCNLPSVYLSGLIFRHSPFSTLYSSHAELLTIRGQAFSFILLCLLYTLCPPPASLYLPKPG